MTRLGVIDGLAHEENGNDDGDHRTEEEGDVSVSPIEPASNVTHPQSIGEGGSEGTRKDITRPEGHDHVQANETIENRRNQE